LLINAFATGENLSVTTSVQVSEWFLGGELAFAFGVNLSVAKLASVANDFLSPTIASFNAHSLSTPGVVTTTADPHSGNDASNATGNDTGVIYAAAFGALLCIASFLSVFVYIRIERYVDYYQTFVDHRNPSNLRNKSHSNLSLTTAIGEYERVRSESRATSPRRGKDSSPRRDTESSRVVEDDGTKLVYGTDGGNTNQQAPEEQHSEMVEVLKFPLILWMLFLSCFVVYGTSLRLCGDYSSVLMFVFCAGCTLPFNNISASLLLERNFFVAPPEHCALKNPNMCQSASNHPNNACSTSQWYQPPLPAGTPTHPLVTTCGNYTTQLTLEDVDCTDACWTSAHGCAKEFCHSLTHAESHAAMVMSIPYALSAVLIPILGLLVDRFGGRALLVSVSALVLVCVHTTLGYLLDIGPIIPLIGQGVAYAMFVTVFWPAVPMVIENRLTGLAFGVAVSVQNGGCALMPVLASLIYTDSGDR
jgi:hypothetical protein